MESEHKLPSFWQVRAQVACRRTAGRIGISLKNFVVACSGAVFPVAIGGFVFGLDFILEEIEPALAVILWLAAWFIWSIIYVASVFIWDYFRAPVHMWKDSQITIRELEGKFVAKLVLGGPFSVRVNQGDGRGRIWIVQITNECAITLHTCQFSLMLYEMGTELVEQQFVDARPPEGLQGEEEDRTFVLNPGQTRVQTQSDQ